MSMWVGSNPPGSYNALLQGEFRFTIVRELGRGGLGCVDEIEITESKAPSKPVGSHWARKRLNKKWDQHPQARARFEREIATLQKLSHARIVSYEGENVKRGTTRFYVMPLYQYNLRAHGLRGATPWKDVAWHGAELADTLQYAHGQGAIHRDLKPENLLYNRPGLVTIADWGIGYFIHRDSIVLDEKLTRGGGLGTAYYCCMQQWANLKCGPQWDVYALGMTLDEWTLGGRRGIAQGQGVSGPAVREDTPGAQHFNWVLRAMTAPESANRLQTMAVVSAQLRHAIALG